jgi:hypothetical protein
MFYLTGDNNPIKATPKMAEIAGVKFYRSKNGNLIRQGVVKAQRYVSRTDWEGLLTSDIRRQMGVKKVNEPCRMFSTTGTSLYLQRAIQSSANAAGTWYVFGCKLTKTDVFSFSRLLSQRPPMPIPTRPLANGRVQRLPTERRMQDGRRV